MATREPRFTKFKIAWHREATPDGTPKWYATVGGVRVAEAVMTGRSGVDNYPWDWDLTDAGLGLRDGAGRQGGVCDTLRGVKAYVDHALRPAGRELRFRPCARCGREPAVHNPHPLNAAYVGHEYE